MEQYTLSRNKRYTVLALVIIIHLLLFFPLFHFSVKQWHREKKGLFRQLDEDDTYIAHHILSSGQQQPAQVLFQDDQQSGQSDSAEQADFVNPFAPQEEEEQDNQMETEEQVDPEESVSQPSPEASASAKASPDRSDKEDVTTMHKALPAAKQEAKPKPKKPRKKRKKRKTTNQQLTLADISRGFIKSMQQEAGYNNTHVQDMRQLALQMYSTKVWNMIKSSFLASENGLHLSRPVDARTALVLTIDRDGRLVDICLHYQRHITELRQIERLIISRAKQVGLFPPLPPQLKAATKTLTFPLHIRGEEGFHTYSLSYR